MKPSELPPPPLNSEMVPGGLITPTWSRWLQLLWDVLRSQQATFTWNPASLSDGAGETSSAVTVPGAAFGDSVIVGAPYDLQGVLCCGYVAAANTVKVRLQNETGSPVDLAEGAWTVRVLKNQ